MPFSDTAIQSAKNKLNLIELIKSDGHHVKKNGSNHVINCPFHNEETASFNIYPDSTYYCFGCGESGDSIKWLQNKRGMSFKEAMEFTGVRESDQSPSHKPYTAPKIISPDAYIFSPQQELEKLPKAPFTAELDDLPTALPKAKNALPKAPGIKSNKPFSWTEYVDRLTEADLEELANWRGFSIQLCRYLKREGLIGKDDRGQWSIPVKDSAGTVYKAHIRMDGKKGWTYYPKNLPNSPLLVGDPKATQHTLICESQWDAFAIMDSEDEWEREHLENSYLITRGASNVSGFEQSLAGSPVLIVVPQNDREEKRNSKTGNTPAEEWTKGIVESVGDSIPLKVAKIPEEHADFNDWWIANPRPRTTHHALFVGSEAPGAWAMDDIASLLKYPTQDPNCLIGDRFLCRGGSLLFSGQSGIGKSTLTMQWVIHLALGIPFFGMTPTQACKVLVIQAENDKGDLAEMARGSINGMRSQLAEDGVDIAKAFENIRFARDMENTGQAFLEKLDRNLAITKPDIIFIDPILSFVGDDISQQTVIASFFRGGLNQLLHKHNCVAVIIHHTGKPSKDANAQKDWSIHDFAYSGLGSSDLTNWARAVALLTATSHDGFYRFLLPKRGGRAGLTDVDGKRGLECWLKHSEHNLCWEQTFDPTNTDDKPEFTESDKKKFKEKARIKECWPSFPVNKDKLIKSICQTFVIEERAAARLISKWISTALITRDSTSQNYEKNF